jgi:Xaa-Pro aminopeptidase
MARYNPINAKLFKDNRAKLSRILKANALVVLNANDIMPTNADGVMPFRQNSDLFYLSGIDQEETILVLYPDSPQLAYKEILFLKETDEQTLIWEGEKYTKAEAARISQIASIYWLSEFEALFNTLMQQADFIYLNTNEHPRAENRVQTRDDRFIGWCQSHYPLHRYERLAPIMQQLRVVKAELEIDLMREACRITEKGFRKILPLVKPGMMEYEIEAELLGEFVRNRSRGFAYGPIVASGANACILHYEANNRLCEAGATILLDVGAEYANYASDMTRVIPVNGRFTSRQRAVYESLLRIMSEAKSMLTLGNDLLTYQRVLGEFIAHELVMLGLLDRLDMRDQDPQNPAYKKYFMHGVSHHIGLNTHDVGDIYQKFQAGMVLTIEPGIYIPEEGLGMRLENMYVIRCEGAENLMESIPLDPDEIEALMHQG